ncbi:MAG TPA: acyltransferase family protein [Steroidobacteraceae bacterium]|nr:acyltransferase family protein [Steroidobacteraceae bacterium]
MQPTDRLHALDAVRAYALLLGVVLHSAAGFLQGFPIPSWVDTPSTAAAVIYFVIHFFRMSAFFLMAGFFARLVVERRGVKAFVKDRSKRIAVPLFLFGPVVLGVLLPIGFVLGALAHGLGYLQALGAQMQSGQNGPVQSGSVFDNILAHLWFLYYLLIFYAFALGLRALVRAVDRRGRIAEVCDRIVAFLMSGIWGPVLIALPIAVYVWQLKSWTEWLGLPAPQSLVPNITAMIGYGIAFGLGWLLNRQPQRLMNLQQHWAIYFVLAIALTICCLSIIGTTPLWKGPNLEGSARIAYAAAYMIGIWCWVFAAVGAAVRFLSKGHPVTRYLADASYWVYIMHMTTILFFITLLRPYHWYWAIKFVIIVGGSMPILLLSYHYFVRFTWIGAILNGRRHPRPQASAPAGTAARKRCARTGLADHLTKH